MLLILPRGNRLLHDAGRFLQQSKRGGESADDDGPALDRLIAKRFETDARTVPGLEILERHVGHIHRPRDAPEIEPCALLRDPARLRRGTGLRGLQQLQQFCLFDPSRSATGIDAITSRINARTVQRRDILAGTAPSFLARSAAPAVVDAVADRDNRPLEPPP